MSNAHESSYPETLPACGPYRSGAALAGHADTVPAGRLVYFHNHSTTGSPMILLPAANRHNRWQFQREGIAVTDGAYVAALVALKREGLYRLREHFHPDDRRVVAANSLVQLGYNANAEPILFFPQPSESDNAIAFPDRGMKIPGSVYDLLEPLVVSGPREPTPVH